MEMPVTRDDHIEAFYSALEIDTVHGTTTPHPSGPARETLHISVHPEERQRITRLGHKYGVPLETNGRYLASAYGETRTLTVCTSPIKVEGIANSYAHAILGIHHSLIEHGNLDLHHTLKTQQDAAQRFSYLLHQMVRHHLNAGPYGTDPGSETPLAGTLSVLLRDTGLLQDAYCYGHDNATTCRLRQHADETQLLEHLATVDLVQVAERLSADT